MQSSIPTIADVQDTLEWMDKFVLVRVDYNVPLSADCSQVVSDVRIIDSMETIQSLVNKGAKVVLCSHLGRPKGHHRPEFSLRTIWQYIVDKNLVRGSTVDFSDVCVGHDRTIAMEAMNAGDVLLLENLRFHHEEEANDEDFARELAHGIDIYVNDAFSVCHRSKFNKFN
jgi:phosphoglycerate kinase